MRARRWSHLRSSNIGSRFSWEARRTGARPGRREAADQLRAFASEVTRVTLKVETGSKAGDSWGTRRSRVDSFIRLGGCEQATKAVAAGDLTKFMNVEVLEEMLDLMMTVNPMYPPSFIIPLSCPALSTLANEVTGVSFEVGTEAILGGQAAVPERRACGSLFAERRYEFARGVGDIGDILTFSFLSEWNGIAERVCRRGDASREGGRNRETAGRTSEGDECQQD
ncbi:hypothetical protein DFP72DRAFT_1106064 [Ephemerocybe angulata]|uniref:Uncharacterized protein n=1 Tax=Ephemerocybe angulata TaxID=980116 RepID=A0A8H6H9F9_9AGAR|nr:hypothetical protein DFP72DRAFT_1106064 [Tulosesus angulatus]